MRIIKLVALLIAASTFALSAQKINVKPSDAVVKWTGNKIGGAHNGEIKIKSGSLELKDGNIVKGSVIIDMKSITCKDIENEDYNKKLVDHLNSDDFFGVEKFPTATFKITSVKKAANGKSVVSGTLTAKGKTNAVSFPAKITVNKGAVNFVSDKFTIDRQKWDIAYKSTMQDVVVKDDIDLVVKFTAK